MMEIESVSCNFNGIDERNKSAKIAEMDKIIAELKKKIKDTERYIANCESGSKSEVFVHQKKDKLKNELLDEMKDADFSDLMRFEKASLPAKMKEMRENLLHELERSNKDIVKLQWKLKNLKLWKIKSGIIQLFTKDIQKMVAMEERFIDEAVTIIMEDFYPSQSLRTLIQDLIRARVNSDPKGGYLSTDDYNVEDYSVLHKLRLIEFDDDFKDIRYID